MPTHARQTFASWLLAIVVSCCLAVPGATAENAIPRPQRVFVCAHSFMTFIAKLLPPMATAGEVGFTLAGHQMIGGSQVIQHWNLPNDKAKPALQAGLVDTLVLSPTLQLPDPGIDNYVHLGLGVNPQLRILVQASWPAFDDGGSQSIEAFAVRAAQFKNTQRDLATVESIADMRTFQRQGWCASLQAQVAKLNTEAGHEAVRIVPVNEAVFALRLRILAGTAPGLTKQTDLFSDPIGHPTPPLTVLVAYCHYAAIFQRSPVGLPLPAVLAKTKQAPELNQVLQEIAWQTVGPQP
jgi:hypothetical protein